MDGVEAVVKELYGLLRPGGRFVFWEHHGSADLVTKMVQRKFFQTSGWSWGWR